MGTSRKRCRCRYLYTFVHMSPTRAHIHPCPRTRAVVFTNVHTHLLTHSFDIRYCNRPHPHTLYDTWSLAPALILTPTLELNPHSHSLTHRVVNSGKVNNLIHGEHY